MEKKLISKFETEELETRFEMGWKAEKVEVQTPYGDAEFDV